MHGVLFYGNNCPHCHELAPFLKKYSNKIDIRLVNASTPMGHKLFESMLKWQDFPASKAGVPLLVIGDEMLIGSIVIPKRLPEILESGQSIPPPPIPGLQFKKLRRLTPTTHLEPHQDDPFANLVAIILLLIMIASVLIVGTIWLKKGFSEKRHILTPILATLGLAIAIYLSYLELSGRAGICGPIGNCDGVQQSPYSTILGIPVGLLGTLNYLLILLFWFWKPKQWILPTLLMIGVLFSIYLTFLEPFVIRAVCFWCLTSATIMTILLWLEVPVHKKSEVK